MVKILIEKQKLLLCTLFVLWLFFVLATFFTVQKPFSAANVAAVGNVWLDLLTTGWLVLVGLGFGSWLLQRLLPGEFSLVEIVILGSGLGLGALGLLTLGLGLFGVLYPLVAYSITILLTVIFAPQLWQLRRQLHRWQPTNLPNRWTILYLSIVGLLALLVALTPPVDWDGLFYHLTGPKLYIQAGYIFSGFDVPHFNFPSLMEMLFTWAMLLRGDVAAKLIHFSYGLLLAGLIYVATQRLLGQKTAWPAVIIFTSMPMLSILAGWAYNDLALAFYQFAGLYSIIIWVLKIKTTPNQSSNAQIQNPKPVLSGAQRAQAEVSKIQNRHWLVLGGLFAGLAMGLKYTGFVTPLVVIGFILWDAYRHTPHASRIATGLANLAIFALTAFIVAFPWYAKNWVFTGNPVYPFLSGLFEGQYWDSFRADWYASAGTGIGWKPTTLLTLPWLLTLGIRDVNFWDGRTGPLLLLFLPLVVWVSFSRHPVKRPTAFNLLLVYVLVHFCFWTMGVIWSRSLWQSRLLLPGLVALVPVVGWVWANLSSFDLPGFSLSRFVNIAVGLVLTLIVIDMALLTLKMNPVPYLVGLENRDQHLTHRLGAYYATMQQINKELPPDAKVVFLWEPRSYYCQRDCRPDSILDTFPHLVYQHGSADAIAQQWANAGISHVLIHRTGLNFVLNEQPPPFNVDILHMLEEQYLEPAFDVAGAYQVYTLIQTSQN